MQDSLAIRVASGVVRQAVKGHQARRKKPRRRIHPQLRPAVTPRPVRHVVVHGRNIPATPDSRPPDQGGNPPPGQGTPFNGLYRTITPSVGMNQFIMAVYNGSTAAFNHAEFVWNNVRHRYNVL